MPEQNNNPLTMDFNAVDTSRLLLAKGPWELTIAKCTLEDATTGPGKQIVMELKNATPGQDSKGEQILADAATVYNRLQCQPTGKSTWAIVNKSIATFVKSVQGGIPGATPNNMAQWVPMCQGRRIKGEVDIDPGGARVIKTGPNAGQTKVYQPSNVISYFHEIKS